MDNWTLASKILDEEEREALYRLLGPIVKNLDGRISMLEIEGYHGRDGGDIWFCRRPGQAITSVMVTLVKRYTSGLNVMCMTHGAGDLQDWTLDALLRLESIAREKGCSKLQIDGCDNGGDNMTCGPGIGWDKIPGGGWREYSRSMEKDLVSSKFKKED